MNQNNFVDWEITKMLPEPNPYVNYDTTQWTWEDVRLYLEDKGFTICYSANPKDCNAFVYKTNFDTDMFLNGYQEIRGTYEEARREAIIFILTLINNEK